MHWTNNSLQKFEALTYTAVTKIMNNFPPPLGDTPELFSSSPYFDLADLVIIPTWHHSDRANYIQHLTTEQLHHQIDHLMNNFPIHFLTGSPCRSTSQHDDSIQERIVPPGS